MPTVHTLKSTFTSDAIYHFRCEYCGQDSKESNTLEQEISVIGLNSPPTVQQLLEEAKNVFGRRQDRILSLANKGKYDVMLRCRNCGFIPSYMINKKRAIGLILLWLVIGAGVAIPFIVPGAMADASMKITFSLLCFVPYLILMGSLIRKMNPNRKLMRIAARERRLLTPPEKPRIGFGPVHQKSK